MSGNNFTKVFSSITESTVWGESHATRIVWVTLLAKADRYGRFYGSIPGLAHLARVTVQEVQEALSAFQRPDPFSRTPDNEGRRIEAIAGGWRLLNHAIYRDREVRDEEQRRAQNREAQRRRRQRLRDDMFDGDTASASAGVSQGQPVTISKSAEADTDTEAELNTSATSLSHNGVDADASAVGELQREGFFEGQGQAEQERTNAAAVHLAAVCAALRAAGCPDATETHAFLVAAITEGFTLEQLRDAATLYAGKPVSYLVKALRTQRDDVSRKSDTKPMLTRGPVFNPNSPSPTSRTESPQEREENLARHEHHFGRLTDSDLTEKLNEIRSRYAAGRPVATAENSAMESAASPAMSHPP